jgi:MFS transporter, DHA3 family, macrolide efflux protein
MKNSLSTFYIIVFTQAISMIGSRLSGLAIGIWLFQETGNVTPLALVAFFGQVPLILSANFAGIVADRFDRRWVLAITDAIQALCSLVLMLLFFSDTFRVEYLYLLTFITALARSFQFPALSSSVAMLVPDEHRNRANAIQQLSEPIGGLIAPAIAGLLYTLVGITGTIAIDLFTFLVAFVAMLLLQLPSPEQKIPIQSLWRELTLGLRFIAQHKSLVRLLILSATINFLGNGIDAIMTPYVLLRTQQNEALLGTLLSVMNAGAIIGGLLIGLWGGSRHRIHIVLTCVIFMGLARIGYGMAQNPATLGLTMFSLMFFPAIANAPLLSIWQSQIPIEIQGRVFSAFFQIAMLTTPLGQAIIGPLADQVFEPAVGTLGWEIVTPMVGSTAGSGIGLLAVIAGIGVIAVGILSYLNPYIRRVEQMPAAAELVSKQTLVQHSQTSL